MIPREVIDEIVARTDLPSLIGSYVSLKRAGSNMNGLCPFHSEKTPSFTVFTATNSFYCFGCGAGGDALTFVMKTENLDYMEAVQLLAKRAGIRLPENQDRFSGAPRFDRQRLFDMNKTAAHFFHSALYENTAEAQEALRYLQETRQLSRATITHFGLGYAPAASERFCDFMLKNGYKEDELIAGFFCGRAEGSGRLYASFRDRVMFPIIDVTGNVIAFGGRITHGDGPKYKNSSDTPIFKKSRNLFALNYAKQNCQEQLILCEGYMDVIALHAAGFTNAVATLGTALTDEQVRIMARYTKKVIISYDMDEAGRRAADRAVRMFGEVGLDVKLLKLQDAKDPDEFIKKFGTEKFKKMLDDSKSKFDYNFERILAQYNVEEPSDKIKALSALTELISGFYSAAERDVYTREVAKKLGVEKSGLEKDVERLMKKRSTDFKKKEAGDVHRKMSGYADTVNRDFVKNSALAKAEEAVLGLLLLYEDHRKAAFSTPILLNETDFFTDLNKRIFAFIKAEYDEGRVPNNFNESFTAEEVGRITGIKVKRMELTDNGPAVFDAAVAALRDAKKEEEEKSTALTRDSFAALFNNLQNN